MDSAWRTVDEPDISDRMKDKPVQPVVIINYIGREYWPVCIISCDVTKPNT